MKRSRLIGIIVCVLLVACAGVLMIVYRPTIGSVTHEKKKPDIPVALANWVDLGPSAVAAQIDAQQTGEAFLLAPNESVVFTVDVPSSGAYRLALDYMAAAEDLNDFTFNVEQDGRQTVTQLYTVWTDADTTYVTDEYGNEYQQRQKMVMQRVKEYLRVYDSVNKSPALFTLSAGENEFILTNTAQGVYISDIYMVPDETLPSYAQYLSDAESTHGNKLGKDLVVIEAEDCAVKSDSFIRYGRGKNPAAYPYDTYSQRINGIAWQSWYTSGQKILWEFEIQDAGFYYIALRYDIGDDVLNGKKSSFRDIEIDGRPLFDEMNGYMLLDKRIGLWDHTLEADGDSLRVYLEKGTHTISLAATTADGEVIVDDIQALMDGINAIGMDLKKLSAGAGDTDTVTSYRTYDMNVYMPGALNALYAYADEIDGLFERIAVYNQDEPVFANNLVYTSKTMRTLLKNTRTLPNRTDALMEGNSSVSASLGSILTAITRQALELDRIYIYGETQPPTTSYNFAQKVSENLHLLFYSFTPDAAKMGVHATYDKNEAGHLNVWLQRAYQYTEMLKSFVRTDYPNTSGIDINVSFISDVNMLVLANASGDNPDIVIAIPYENISNFAIRGAAKNLLEFEGFLPFYNEYYDLESLVPLCYDGKVYGAMDNHTMSLLYYRKDILESLGLSVPDTWDDVADMMPTLTRYSMNFYLPIALEVAKKLDTTAPFFFQNGGELYANGGKNTAINSENSIKGFRALTDLFKIYGVRQSVPNFVNSFRYGEVPIGIGNVDTYFTLMLTAPELSGKWGIALVPGVKQPDGSIDRSYPSAYTATMIFDNTKHPQEAYEFLEWWLKTDTQVNYAYALRTLYGPEYSWIPGNDEAMSQLYFPKDDLEIIMEQRTYEKESFRHLAWYMLERNISDAFINVVTKDRNARVEIDRAALETDREISKKLIEFGYMDADGNVLKPFETDTVDRLREGLR